MPYSRERIIKLLVMSLFLCCMFFANFIAVRMMLRYGVYTYFYDKLLVAYDIGGYEGFKIELARIPTTDKLVREQRLAKDLNAKLDTITNPEEFLKEKVQESKKKTILIRDLRTAAIYIMFVLFGWQMFANLARKTKSGRSV